MKVTVFLPVYNAAPTLRQAVESILAQDLAEFELIVTDDGSTDGSRELISEYAATDRRIRSTFHRHNVGLPASLNEALRQACGEYFVRMDADDESLPHRLGVQLDFMERHRGVAVAGSYVYHMGARPKFDHLIELPTGPGRIRKMLRIENCIYHPSVIMRREEILRLGGYRVEFRNAEDYDLWLRASKLYELDNIPEPLLRYRFSAGGQTLRRRWEQQFYFLLAQAADDQGDGSLGEARRRTDEEISKVNRKIFVAATGVGTVAELARLRLWSDASTVAVRLLKDPGPLATVRVAVRLGIAAVRVRLRGSRAPTRAR